MATTGAAYDNFSGRPRFRLRLGVTQDAVSGNKSRYRWSLKVENLDNSNLTYAQGSFGWYVNVEGSSWSGSSASLDFRDGASEHTVATGTTGWKTHNSNGDLTVNFRGSYNATSSVFGRADADDSFKADRLVHLPGKTPPVNVTRTTTSAIYYSGGSPSTGGTGYTRSQHQITESGTGWSNPTDTKTYPYPSGVPEFTFSGLAPGTRYGIRVRYENAAGYGDWSDTVYGTTVASDPPRNLTVSNVGPNSAHATWQAPSAGAAVTGYRVQYATNQSFTNAVTTSTTSPAADLAGLTAATKYWVRVLAITAAGDSAYTSAVTFTTLANVPTAPLNVQATSPGAGAAEVTWQVPTSNGGTPIVGYMVQWSTDPTFASTLGQATPSRSPYTVQNLTPGVNVYFRVAARNGSGYGPWSAVASLNPTAGAWIKKAGTWQHAVVWIKKGGTWTKVQRVLTKKAGTWQ